MARNPTTEGRSVRGLPSHDLDSRSWDAKHVLRAKAATARPQMWWQATTVGIWDSRFTSRPSTKNVPFPHRQTPHTHRTESHSFHVKEHTPYTNTQNNKIGKPKPKKCFICLFVFHDSTSRHKINHPSRKKEFKKNVILFEPSDFYNIEYQKSRELSSSLVRPVNQDINQFTFLIFFSNKSHPSYSIIDTTFC